LQSAPRRVERTPAPTRPSSPGWIAVIVFGLLAAIGVFIAVGLVGAYIVLSRDLVKPQELAAVPPHEESIVYDRTGKVELARFGDIKREAVTYDELPKILIDATTAVEDKSFWTNTGFDPLAIASAGLDALRGRSRGASTITQQLVRQRLLDPRLVQSDSRTLERKLKEIIQSIRLTQFYSGEEGKQQIITAYLNQNFYGNSSYGVKAAARSYFNKDLKDLTLSEAAILAGLPQSPSSYDLVRNAIEQDDGTLVVPPDTEIVQRRNLVLDLLAEGRTPLSGNQYTAADFAAAKQDPVVLAPQTDTRWIAPHFVWAVRDELTRTLCGEGVQTCGDLEQGGLRITSTLDVKLQKSAEKWVQAAAIVPKAKDPKAAAKALGLTYDTWMQRLRGKDLNNGALVAIDYQTGELVAYVGSADYYATKGNRQFQPKFDVVGDGYRQPGSAFKPFNYLTGIDDRTLTASTMFMDAATDFGGKYSPTDADNLERGPVRVRMALQFSLNIPSVKAAAVNRPEHVFARVQDFGMRFRPGSPTPGLALALGVQETRPVDLVTAYATLANQGRYIAHTTILRAQDANGEDKIPPHDEKATGQQVASPEAAAIVTDILAGNTDVKVNPFWGKFAIVDAGKRRPATLKTGTNNDAKDLNAYGFIAPPSADGRAGGEYALAVGVWNGNSDNSVVGPVFSIEVSTFVWQGFLTEATKGWKINNFTLPDTLVSADVDPWTGLKPEPGGKSVKELFIRGTAPEKSVANAGGACGQGVLETAGFESRFDNWMKADRDWIARAQRGPGVAGGPDRTRTTYFYNRSFMPYGASWGPILSAASCGTPAPTPSCFVVPTPDASGIVPSFEAPTPSGSGPAPEPCPTPSTEATPTPTPLEPSIEPPASVPPIVTPTPEPSVVPSVVPSAAAASGGPAAPAASGGPAATAASGGPAAPAAPVRSAPPSG
jgi:membrane peptidoglycan carboxypeptidase